MSNRAFGQLVQCIDALTLQNFIGEHVEVSATVYAAEHSAYRSLPFSQKVVRQSIGEYDRE